VTIIDEFDSFVFERDQDAAIKISAILDLEKLIMFSGSEFQNHHRKFLQEFLNCSFVDLSMRSMLKSKPVLEKKLVFTSISEQRNAIVNTADERTLKAPVIIIQQHACETLIGKLRKLKIRVENLGACDFTQIPAVMRTFTVAGSFRYPVFVIT
jgi:hypothetical protein